MYLSISARLTRAARETIARLEHPRRDGKKGFTAAFKLRNYVINGGGVLFVRKSGYRAAYIYFTRCERSAARLC